jgi:serine/threonine protein kinase
MMASMADTLVEPGSRVGNYLLVERIGQGAFSEVWKAAHHERPNRVVAVKIATEPGFRKQLCREGRLPEIDHPNVVPILDSDTRFAEIPYIVMPYLPGGNLSELIAKHPNGLPEETVSALLDDILSGLAAAHTQGIVHRDIKPANVLLDQGGRAIIADFGLSLSHTGGDDVRSIIQSVSVEMPKIAGTLAYMAPEVREGETATPASDIYSVGVLLFEMLVGRRPYGRETPSESATNLRQEAQWNAFYDGACKPPKGRYCQATAMLEALEKGVKAAPMVREAEPVALPVNADLPDPEPLPDALWEALEVRWDECAAARLVSTEQDERIEEALKAYTAKHPILANLRAEAKQIEAHQQEAERNLRDACDITIRKIDERQRRMLEERSKLLEAGLGPDHPDAVAIDVRSRSYAHLRGLVDSVPNREESNLLLGRMREFQQAWATDTIGAYETYLDEHGTGVMNPWAAKAESRLAELANDKSRSVARFFVWIFLFLFFLLLLLGFLFAAFQL